MQVNTGFHIVKKARAGKPPRWYVYAWRGGPQIHVADGRKPTITTALNDKANELRRKLRMVAEGTMADLIGQYRASPDYLRLAKSTTANWGPWLDRIQAKFGVLPLDVFNDRRMRGDILEWRDGWAHKPRTADMAIQVMSRLLSFGFDRGRLTSNIIADTERLYENDRSDLIWELSHFEAFLPQASVEVQEGVNLLACTGLRRGDLVRLPRTAIGDFAIIWKTAKSGDKTDVTIPLLPETRQLVAAIDARWEAEAARRKEKGKPMPARTTLLFNSRYQPWTAMGFGSRFNDAKQASGIDRNLHDIRGTFATRCMVAGLTDQEIADILGWGAQDVSAIRKKYVDQARVVIALAERIASASVNRRKPIRDGEG